MSDYLHIFDPNCQLLIKPESAVSFKATIVSRGEHLVAFSLQHFAGMTSFAMEGNKIIELQERCYSWLSYSDMKNYLTPKRFLLLSVSNQELPGPVCNS